MDSSRTQRPLPIRYVSQRPESSHGEQDYSVRTGRQCKKLLWNHPSSTNGVKDNAIYLTVSTCETVPLTTRINNYLLPTLSLILGLILTLTGAGISLYAFPGNDPLLYSGLSLIGTGIMTVFLAGLYTTKHYPSMWNKDTDSFPSIINRYSVNINILGEVIHISDNDPRLEHYKMLQGLTIESEINKRIEDILNDSLRDPYMGGAIRHLVTATADLTDSMSDDVRRDMEAEILRTLDDYYSHVQDKVLSQIMANQEVSQLGATPRIG